MFRCFVRLAVLVAAPLILMACQTTSKSAWTEWKEISESQSAVTFAWPPQAKPVSITRWARKDKVNYTRAESWDWISGRALAVILPANRYYPFSKRDPSRLIAVPEKWKFLKEIGLTIVESSVKRGVNSVGHYFYAASDQNSGNQTCFVFHQALPHDGQSGYETTKGVAGGFLNAYECQPTSRVSVAEMEQLMIPFVEGVRMRN